VGPTGPARPPLVNLISRRYDAAPGMVLIDGRLHREVPIHFLRHNIGFVPQRPFCQRITSPGARRSSGEKTRSDADIHDAAEAANIAADIEEFPEAAYHRSDHAAVAGSERTAKMRAAMGPVRNPRILILADALSSVFESPTPKTRF